MQHKTVLLHEAVAQLHIQPGMTVVDATLGNGGHTREIVKQLKGEGQVFAFDADITAIKQAQFWIEKETVEVQLCHNNFSELETVLQSHKDVTCVNAVLADLGWRTDQFLEGNKGFSFHGEEPLLMTYGEVQDDTLTAHDVVNTWAEQDIANVLFAYGEETAARKYAKEICAYRTQKSIETSKELAEIIYNAAPHALKKAKIHPATKTFQALRIVVNDELKVLESFIEQAYRLLCPDGVLAIISFHSLEDRIIKHSFRDIAKAQAAEILTKKPLLPSREEIISNKRARSAKLRAIKKTR